MMKRFWLAAPVLALIAGLGLWAAQTPSAPGQTLLPGMAALADTTTAPATTDAAPATAAITIPDMVLGNAAAKVTLMEYASFTCPHCAHFHEEVFKSVKRDYIDTGKVRFVFREVYFDRYGLWASMMARCGGETRYFGIAAMLFEGQREWAGSDDPNTVIGNLRRIGKTAGMDDAALDTCLQDAATAQALLTNYETHAAEDKVEGTPTLFIDGVKYSNMAYEDLKALLDTALAK